MSGKLSWALEVTGVDQVAKKLSDLDKLASTVGGKKGISIKDFSNISASTKALNPDLFKAIGEKSGKQFADGIKKGAAAPLAAFMNQSLGIGAGQNRPNASNYANFWKSAVPPFIQPPLSLIQRLSGAMGGGRVGGLLSLVSGGQPNALSAVFGALGAFRIALWELQPVIYAVKFSFKALADAIERGSKLFLDSARVGTSQNNLSHVRNSLGLIGVNESEADSLLASGQFGNQRKAGTDNKRGQTSRSSGAIDFFGQILGGRGNEQKAELQQITNLQKEALMAWQDTNQASITSALSARTLFEVGYNFKVVMIDIKAEFEGLAALIAGPLKAGFAGLHVVLEPLLQQLNIVLALGQKVGLIPKGEDFNKSLGSGQRIPVSQFEHLGFHFGQGKYNPMNEVAKNTAKIAQNTGLILASIIGGNPFAAAAGAILSNAP